MYIGLKFLAKFVQFTLIHIIDLGCDSFESGILTELFVFQPKEKLPKKTGKKRKVRKI